MQYKRWRATKLSGVYQYKHLIEIISKGKLCLGIGRQGLPLNTAQYLGYQIPPTPDLQ